MLISNIGRSLPSLNLVAIYFKIKKININCINININFFNKLYKFIILLIHL